MKKLLLILLCLPMIGFGQTQAFISGNDSICDNVNANIYVAFSGGIPPYQFVYAINGVNQPTITTTNNPYVISTSMAGTYTLQSYNDAISVGTVSGSALVTVLQSFLDITSETACDSYSWNGQTYTTSGLYSNAYTNAAGCDSIYTLDLTIHYSTISTSSDTACDSYTSWWTNGNTYTTSGTYIDTTSNMFGCTHTSTLYLTIINSPNTSNILGITNVNYLQTETYSVGQNLNSTFNWYLNSGGIILNGVNTNSAEVQWGNNSGIFELYVVETAQNGCSDTVFIDINVVSSTSIQEHTTNKELLKVTDLLGRETKQTNQPLFYIYDDGTVEKRIVIE